MSGETSNGSSTYLEREPHREDRIERVGNWLDRPGARVLSLISPAR